jgi:hypothetical protein
LRFLKEAVPKTEALEQPHIIIPLQPPVTVYADIFKNSGGRGVNCTGRHQADHAKFYSKDGSPE